MIYFLLLVHNATLNTTNCTYNFRKRREFTSVPLRTVMRKKHITFSGPYAWEALPDYIKQSDSFQIFKSELYIYLKNSYNTTDC